MCTESALQTEVIMKYLAWFLITGVLMVVQGAAGSKDDAV